MRFQPQLLRLLALVWASIWLPAPSTLAAPGDVVTGWPVSLSGVIFGAPAVGQHGEIVVATQSVGTAGAGVVYSLNPDGSQRWAYTGAGDWIDSSPVIADDGTVYFGCWDGKLYALEGETGALKWTYSTGPEAGDGLIVATPAIGPDGTIYIGSYDGVFYAIHPDGSLRWSMQPRYWSGLSSVIDASPVTSGAALNADADTLYFGTQNGNLYAVAAASGTQLASYSLSATLYPEREISGTPAIGSDGAVYFASENGILYCLNASLQFSWRFVTTEKIKSSPILTGNDTVIFAAQDGYLYCIDSEGLQIWETFIGDVFYCTPALDANGNIIIGAYDGTSLGSPASVFTSVNPAGAINWEIVFTGYQDSSPNIAPDGSIYIGAHNGSLYRIEGQAPLAADGWPRFHNNRRQTAHSALLGAIDLLEIFPDISAYQNGWALVPWFGAVAEHAEGFPWVRHATHGPLWIGESAAYGMTYWDLGLSDWVQAPRTAPDCIHRFSTGDWLDYTFGVSEEGGRWFYNFTSQGWIWEYD